MFPYLLDQDFAIHPEAVAHFDLLMRIVAAAVEKKPDAPIAEIVRTHTTPLFEMLQKPAGGQRAALCLGARQSHGRSEQRNGASRQRFALRAAGAPGHGTGRPRRQRLVTW